MLLICDNNSEAVSSGVFCGVGGGGGEEGVGWGCSRTLFKAVHSEFTEKI